MRPAFARQVRFSCLTGRLQGWGQTPQGGEARASRHLVGPTPSALSQGRAAPVLALRFVDESAVDPSHLVSAAFAGANSEPRPTVGERLGAARVEPGDAVGVPPLGIRGRWRRSDTPSV